MEKLNRRTLHQLQEKLSGEIAIRQTGNKKAYITVNMGDCGLEHGAKKVFKALCDGVDARGLRGQVIVTQTSIEGLCEAGPLVEVLADGMEPVRYVHVSVADADRIIEDHVLNKTVLNDLVLRF